MPLRRKSARSCALARAAAGEAGAFAEFYDLYAQRVLIFHTRRTADAEIAIDLTSETFARALAGCRSFRGDNAAAEQAWLFKIAHNELNRFLERGYYERAAASRFGIHVPDIGDEEIERIEALAGLQQLRPRISAAMQELPDEQQEAIRLRIIEERDYAEVADRCGISEEVARARVSRGLRAMGQELGDMDRLGIGA